jgi:MOSC domain-containing protein YiiM
MSLSRPTVISINISPGGIPKRPIDRGRVIDTGLVGDAHNHPKHGGPKQALCLFDIRVLDALRAEGFDVYPGAVGENLTISGLDVEALVIGDRLLFSGGVEAEISKRRSPCATLDPIHPDLKTAMVGRSGWYARVLVPGEIRTGETIEVVRGAAAAATDSSTSCGLTPARS